jgi:hypothetical protein
VSQVRTETMSVMDAPACLSASWALRHAAALPQRSPREVFRRPEAGRAREDHEVAVCWNTDGAEVAATVAATPVPIPLILFVAFPAWGEYWSEAAGRSRLVAVS